MLNLLSAVLLSCLSLSTISFGQSQQPEVIYGPPGFTPGEPLSYSGGDDGGGAGGCKNMYLKANEELVRNFYQDALGNKRGDLLDKYLAQDYLNHSPFSSGPGINDFAMLLKGPLTQAPNQQINFRRVNAIDDVVWAHSSWELAGKTYAAMDIFQINCDGLIQEHWDVIQDINAQPSRNPVAFF